MRLRRLARKNALPDRPFVVADFNGHSQIIVAACPRAAIAGIGPGMTLAHARALYSQKITIARANPMDDARALDRLAVWFLRFSPLVAPDHPDGLFLDATGVAHLFGGEEKMVSKIIARLNADNVTTHVAMADTPGAAWAYSHYANGGVINSGETREALLPLPVAALRLKRPVVESLNRVGVWTVGDLLKLPRSTIPHRFGRDVMGRLDQALGKSPEAISPVLPPDAKHEVMKFFEPISTRAGLERAAMTLCKRLCHRLELNMEGAKRLDLLFHRVDSQIEAIRIGTAQATHDPNHLAKMFIDKLDLVDPGFGIEVVTLTANITELVKPQQTTVLHDVDVDRRDLATLADRLTNLHGMMNVFKATATESGMPERAVRRVPVTEQDESVWPKARSRPIHLFERPEVVEVTAMLPDHPPVMFRWRGKVHKIKRADGPERIQDEWWQCADEIGEIRDYFKVENEAGERYWIFRDNRLTQSQTYRWYLHGVFA